MNWYIVNTFWLNSIVDAKPQCVTDSDCDIDKECYQGSCRFACSSVSCGQNAVCVPQFHNGVCECLNGFKGNPTIACKKGKRLLLYKFVKIQIHLYITYYLLDEIIVPPVEFGCASNNDCPDYTACQNRKCINPCAEDNICAPNAICTVTRHKAVCACPDGYIGTPEISCSLRKFITIYWIIGFAIFYVMHKRVQIENKFQNFAWKYYGI